ncbi:tyrosine-type recombinase/integrase [Bradyrhizobium sp. 186]|uniref:tyrosine-type recombinase/integrase n=1 Tax=Bradyrhizobium sp. 186 TaxID=2782654 RepID=UPI0020008148|nr:tyrosine-type recombinase/integrase [Bradyrhizobium sp. 186]UPK33337.1 tyrosine-type recombinase/integrase [Bradyrhizobium sp. 186]
MPKPRNSSLETPTARLRLPIKKRPHWQRLGPGLSLGYRRNEGTGTWSIRASDGRGGEWLKKFGIADDYETADGKGVLDYSQAITAARKLVRGGDDDDVPEEQGNKPVTLDIAMTRYEYDLTARGANVYNARTPRGHLTAALLSKPVPLLGAQELRKWRDGLLAKMAPASVNRHCKNIIAALNLAASQDQRIRNRHAWQTGLQMLPDATEANNVILPDDHVSKLVTASYVRDEMLGLLMDVLAVTGTRPSQAARLNVRDLVMHKSEPKLMMPKSGKGGGRNRSRKRVERYSVPITQALAIKLAKTAVGRPAHAPLLVQSNGKSWGLDGKGVSDDYREDITEVIKSIGLDPNEVTPYALRHSSIVRQLLRNVPVRVVAATHNTSVAEIERTYSKYITEHSDAVSRRALLHHDAAPLADNVVALAG